MYTASLVFFLPYLNVYLDENGASKQQIGVLSALRPWLSAPSAVLLTGLADKLDAQRAVLVVAFAASATLRTLLLVAPSSIFATGALVLLADCVASPVGVIIDSIVVASCVNVSALCQRSTPTGALQHNSLACRISDSEKAPSVAYLQALAAISGL